ncbi:hypothetical protein H4Q26_005084 [Puccinia striiformis f. sp. tritici PST-130]|nr:hypothetical protein H4Q26_005084 [Puccinia striiformis f. sp. tritici PST-130]
MLGMQVKTEFWLNIHNEMRDIKRELILCLINNPKPAATTTNPKESSKESSVALQAEYQTSLAPEAWKKIQGY